MNKFKLRQIRLLLICGEQSSIIVKKINIEIMGGLGVKDVTGGPRQDDLRTSMWI